MSTIAAIGQGLRRAHTALELATIGGARAMRTGVRVPSPWPRA